MWWMAATAAAAPSGLDVPTYAAQVAQLMSAAARGVSPDDALKGVGAGPDGRFPAAHAFTTGGVVLDDRLSCAVRTWTPLTLACSLGFSGTFADHSKQTARVEGQTLVFDPMPAQASGWLTMQDEVRARSRLLQRLDAVSSVSPAVDNLWSEADAGRDLDAALREAGVVDEPRGGRGAAIAADAPPPLVEVLGSGTATPVTHQEAVETVMRRYAGQLVYCYEVALKRTPGHVGDYLVVATVREGDVVGPPEVVGQEAALAQCVASKMRRWVFPTWVDATVTWTWTMQPKAPK